MAQNEIFFAKDNDPKMNEAFKKARESFKYFWREVYWEYRRIAPALNLACVKAAFFQNIKDKNEPVVEHMWINNINFDGERIRGVLINEPNELTCVRNGDRVEVFMEQVSDWLFAIKSKTYGGFTIQTIRSDLGLQDRRSHDDAWRLDFGDCNKILIAYGQEEHPENLIEHPMSKNMRDKFAEFIMENPSEITNKDEFGYTMLHKEAIAGNKTTIEILLQFGADKTAKTNSGKSALDFAKKLNWEHIIPLLRFD
jgi:uncharacterized protein YegJ (DUF2314 family)